jgi:hypothetical protein
LQPFIIYGKNYYLVLTSLVFCSYHAKRDLISMEQIDIIEILRQFKDENHQQYSIMSIGIFASAARDSLNDQSDTNYRKGDRHDY